MRNWKRAIDIAVELFVDLINSEFSGSKYKRMVCEEMFIGSMNKLLPIFEKKRGALTFKRILMILLK